MTQPESWPFDTLTPRKYSAIVADPPWHFRARTALQTSDWTIRRDVEKHYPVMGINDIKALPVRDLAAKDAHLFLWTTGPCLRMAFDVIEAWGFRYSAMAFTWIKTKKHYAVDQYRAVRLAEEDLHVGLGLTTRKNAEFVLLGRRGSPHRNSKSIREIILAPRREHSRKPDQMYDRVQAYCDGPYLELFARQSRDGWSSWGNEVGKFNAADQGRTAGRSTADVAGRPVDRPGEAA